ncbi:unnamed protein product, partial [Arabidopsis halleri]
MLWLMLRSRFQTMMMMKPLEKTMVTLIMKTMTRGRTSSTKRVANRTVKNRDSSLNVDDSKGKANKADEEKKGSSKKKSAASFLKRMKVGSSDETLKPSSAADSSTTGKG